MDGTSTPWTARALRRKSTPASTATRAVVAVLACVFVPRRCASRPNGTAAHLPGPDHDLPLAISLRALGRGDIATAHKVLGRLTREGGATSLTEMLPEGGHGRALRDLFDALGAALAADPTERQVWEMLTWVQTLWIDAMLTLESLRVHSPDQVGAMLRFPLSDGVGRWEEEELKSAELCPHTGILSLSFVRPITLTSQKSSSSTTTTSSFFSSSATSAAAMRASRVELGLGRKGAGMWSAHDEIAWADCQVRVSLSSLSIS